MSTAIATRPRIAAAEATRIVIYARISDDKALIKAQHGRASASRACKPRSPG